MIHGMWSPERKVQVRLRQDSKSKKADFSLLKPAKPAEFEAIYESRKSGRSNEKRDTSFEVSSSIISEVADPFASKKQSKPPTLVQLHSKESIYEEKGKSRVRERINSFSDLVQPRNIMPLKLMRDLSAKVRDIRDTKLEEKQKYVVKENMRKIEVIERNHDARVAKAEAEFAQEQTRFRKEKQDIFRWMKLPVHPKDNVLLNKMVRIRLLEILSDVPFPLTPARHPPQARSSLEENPGAEEVERPERREAALPHEPGQTGRLRGLRAGEERLQGRAAVPDPEGSAAPDCEGQICRRFGVLRGPEKEQHEARDIRSEHLERPQVRGRHTFRLDE